MYWQYYIILSFYLPMDLIVCCMPIYLALVIRSLPFLASKALTGTV